MAAGFPLRPAVTCGSLRRMPVVECRGEVLPGAAGAVERAMAAQEDSRWTVWKDRRAGRTWVAGYFTSRAGAAGAWRRLAQIIGPARLVGGPEVRELADTDWRESYKAHFKAWRIGRLHWAPVWKRQAYAVPQGDKVVWLDPGLAFGTGNHPPLLPKAGCVRRDRRPAPGNKARISARD